MAKVIPIGQPANESERQAIGFLRDHLPDGWLIFHNFEMRQGQEVFEIDIAILAPHAVYLVDVKGTRGNIDVYGSKWYPEGRQPFFSPLASERLQTWVTTHPQDAQAWQWLAQAWQAQNQPLRALRAQAEAQVAIRDFSAAQDRLKAAQDLARRGSNQDHIEASIIDTRLRAVQSLLREQAAQR